MSKKIKKKPGVAEEDKKFPLPIYKKEDDIYSREKEEPLGDEEQPGKIKSGNDKNLGDELDVPGTELDDANEDVGEEDEENNYYSLGGDSHDDLEEDKG